MRYASYLALRRVVAFREIGPRSPRARVASDPHVGIYSCCLFFFYKNDVQLEPKFMDRLFKMNFSSQRVMNRRTMVPTINRGYMFHVFHWLVKKKLNN